MKNQKTLVVIAVSLLIFLSAGFYVDSKLRNSGSQTSIFQYSGGAAEVPQLDNYGKAPDFIGIDKWLNSDPLTMQQLKGKVVLVDFWTYSCINCIRTLPYVTKWYDAYKDDGLVVIGVHTPEFAFEKNSDNVQSAIKSFNIHYPVAQDNEYATWNAYGNQYWPAEYLIDKNGNIVHEHFGEGEYDVTENTIRYLLGVAGKISETKSASLGGVRSPEMYFGFYRLQNLNAGQIPSAYPKTYSLPSDDVLNYFALGGTWKFNSDDLQLTEGTGKIRLKFNSGKIHMVASSDIPARLGITVDGKEMPSVTVKDPRLYTLFDSNDYAEHVIEITVNQPGFKAFTFTFG